MNPTEIPLFPLRTVLYPEGQLKLRIFEPRYLDMVRDCTRDDSVFGVCLIQEGEEAATPVRSAQVGTLARIVDWYTLEDGLLGVSAVGTQRFVAEETWRDLNGLYRGWVRTLPDLPRVEVPVELDAIRALVASYVERFSGDYPGFTPDRLDDAAWVAYRLAELLPLTDLENQKLLEIDEPVRLLEVLMHVLPRFAEE
jgi:Lon protease-like protein